MADQGGVTSIQHDGQLLLEYRSQPNPMKVYVSKWCTPQGTQVLRDSPHDHVHHRALMFAIGIDNCDFWSEVPPQDYGKQVLRWTASVRLRPASNGRSQVVIKQTINWVNPQSEVLAVESRVITAHQGAVELRIAPDLGLHADADRGQAAGGIVGTPLLRTRHAIG